MYYILLLVLAMKYGEIMFLNDNQYLYVYLYWGKCPLGQIRPPPSGACPGIRKPLGPPPGHALAFANHYFFHFR